MWIARTSPPVDPKLWLQIPLGFAFMALVVWFNVWLYRRAVRSMERWVAANALRVLERRFGWFLRRSFPWVVARGTYSFKVTVEDATGTVRRGWIYVSGMTQSKVRADWEPAFEPATAFPVVPTERQPGGGR